VRKRLARALVEAGALVLVAAVVGLIANQFSSRAASLRGAEPRSIPVLSNLALPQARAIHQAGSMLFLDAREPAAFLAGHVPGSLNIPSDTVDESAAAHQGRLDDAGGYVVYCDSPEGEVARTTAQALLQRGLGNLYLFPGGWSQWTAAGLPVSEGPQ